MNIKKPRHSIQHEITIIFIALMAGTIMLCTLINNFFLEKYYVVIKQQKLLNAYEKIDTDSAEGDINSSDYDVDFEKLCSNSNISLLIIDSGGNIMRSSSSDSERLKRQFLNAILASEYQGDIIENNDSYVLQRNTDSNTELDYLVLWGSLKDGNIILMRTPIESIRESVSISNTFLEYTGIFAILLCAVLIMFISKKITRPILELAEISEKMTALDFDAKYTSGGDNEIGLLGEHINQMSQTLEHTISELKTANNELQIDLEKKEQIDEMRKEFLSNVSHELKTPIALIQGYAEGLKECINDDDESRDFYCDVIMDESDKMNNMVKKLLTLNQLEFGNDTVTLERFDIVALINGIIMSTEILIKQKNIKLIFNEKDPIYVWADEFKIEEVVTNFLSNAINHVKYENTIEIRITKKQDGIRVAVFNSGDTILQTDLEKIWIKFYKVDKARTREYGGNGIGLSIVKAIMESLHKDFGVINYDNGVEFYFELDNNLNIEKNE